ncbi:MAG TPA: GNAT family N-acetyltransferase [Jatrophihabitantaceae bacterium]
MNALRIEPVGDATLADWQHVHNLIIPTAPLSLDEVRERLGRNQLEVAYCGNVLVGNSTVRPPADGVATVIVRILPEHRRQGYGAELLAGSLAVAESMGARGLETIVLESNVDGLRFARAHGFVDEVDRYLPDGEYVAFVTLRRPFALG